MLTTYYCWEDRNTHHAQQSLGEPESILSLIHSANAYWVSTRNPVSLLGPEVAKEQCSSSSKELSVHGGRWASRSVQCRILCLRTLPRMGHSNQLEGQGETSQRRWSKNSARVKASSQEKARDGHLRQGKQGRWGGGGGSSMVTFAIFCL